MADSAPVNFFGGSPLNRLSWLRSSQPFLNAIISSGSTRWLVFKDGKVLMSSSTSNGPSSKPSPAFLSTKEVRALLGPDPFFSQGQHEGDLAAPEVPLLEAARFRGPPIVFLGLQEAEGEDALPSSDFSAKTDPAAVAARIKGTPYFSLDVSELGQKDVDVALQSSVLARGAIIAEGRSMVDWNARNKFCPACGSPVYSLWAGWKLSCLTLLPWSDNTGRKPCPTATGLHNFAHPRTDAVIITVVTNAENDKILLGRNRKWPGKFYSALAGFIEPGETLEDAVKRELWEEAGVKVWGVRYHSTQPWPFPANLMVGFYAIADPSVPTRTDLDNELEDAQWFTREEIIAILTNPEGTNINARGPEKPFEKKVGSNATEQTSDEPPFRVPPVTAVAGLLISDWAYRKVYVGNSEQKKGNL
ncbi:unnamed protein product [Somion occarium]|uniref:NAD(+) diphosphatase n=1 Tax=Somion occarium TaxID=3059160 RepID=A0ABP1DE92_9APHY